MHRGAPDVWDYQWNCSCWAQNGLAILPAVNLVSNHGYGPDATHTKDLGPYMNNPTQAIGEIRHPLTMVRNYHADAYTFAHNFGGNAMKAAECARRKAAAKTATDAMALRAVRKLFREAIR